MNSAQAGIQRDCHEDKRAGAPAPHWALAEGVCVACSPRTARSWHHLGSRQPLAAQQQVPH